MPKKPSLILEFTLLFIGLPTVIWQFNLHNYFIIFLWVFGLGSYFYLKGKDHFHKKDRPPVFTRPIILRMILLLISGTITLSIYTYLVEPQRFLGFVSNNTAMWAMVMVLYPLLSVYPQELIFRGFLFERYRDIFRDPRVMIAMSSIAFGYAHIIFNNFISVFLCTLGGIIFGMNYNRNRSLLLVSIEHALYGCMIFTVGLGYYFYRGAVPVN